MKTEVLTIAMAALSLLSIPGASAETYSYNLNGSSVMTNSAVLGGTNVLTYPAVISGTAALDTSCAPLFGKLTHYDDAASRDNRGLLSGLFGSNETRVITNAAVIPSGTIVGGATQVCGQQRANEMFSLRLFGFGLGAGKVNPDFDARPLGHAGP